MDIECSDFFDCIRLLSALKKDFPEKKRVLVLNRKLSAEDEAIIKGTFDADKILNLHTTDDFLTFFRNAFSGRDKSI